MAFPFARGIALLALMFCVPTPGLASSPSVTFDEVVAAAERSGPGAAEISVKAARERMKGEAVGNLENPELDAEVRPYVSDHDDRDTEFEISLSQPLTRSSFGQRSEVARLTREQADKQRDLELLELRQFLKLQYGKAWALQERERQLVDARVQARKLLSMADKLAGQGAAVRSSVSLIRAEAERLEAELTGLEADKSRALAELTKQSGLSLRGRRLMPPELPALPSTLPENLPLPSREGIQAAARLAAAQYELARLDSSPSFSPRIGFARTSDGDETVILGVQVGLPVFNGNQANRKAAEAEMDYQRVLQSLHDGVAFADQLENLRAAAYALSEQSGKYREKVLPALDSAIAASQDELEAGQGSPFQIWQTLQTVNEAQHRSLELWVEALAARVELSILAGRDF